MLVTTTFADLNLATGAVGTTTAAFTSLWSGAKIILATNLFQPTKTRLLADLTQPTYTGYAAIPITWSAATYDPNGIVSVFSQLATFKATGGTPSATCYGYGIVNAAATQLLGSDTFAAPLGIQDLNATINVVVNLPLQLSQTGQAVAFS